MHSSGYIYDYGYVDYKNTVYPSAYLSTNVKISGGSGEKSDPFTLNL